MKALDFLSGFRALYVYFIGFFPSCAFETYKKPNGKRIGFFTALLLTLCFFLVGFCSGFCPVLVCFSPVVTFLTLSLFKPTAQDRSPTACEPSRASPATELLKPLAHLRALAC